MSVRTRKVAYYITPHGYGHAVRSLEVIRSLLRMNSGVEVTIVSEIPEFLVAQNIGHSLPYRRRRLDIGLVQLDSIRFDLASTLSQLINLQARAEELLAEETQFLKAQSCDLVVADIPFMAFLAADRCGIPSLGIGNFTWDWIYSAYVEHDPKWRKVMEWICQCYGHCDLLLQLPMHGDCSACPRRMDVPLVARRAGRRPLETRRLVGIHPQQPAYLIAFADLDLSGSALRALETIPEALFLFKHPLQYNLSNGICLDGLDLSYADAIAAVDAVITKPGYGIVSDCLAHGTPMIYTDRGVFPEYRILVDTMREHLPVAFISPDDLCSGNWVQAILEIRRASARPPTIRTDGAEICARTILERLEGS